MPTHPMETGVGGYQVAAAETGYQAVTAAPLAGDNWVCLGNEQEAQHHQQVWDAQVDTSQVHIKVENTDILEEAIAVSDEKCGGKISQKQSQNLATLHWLVDNYERQEGVCLPRCVLYTHYQDFCKKEGYSPAGAATFGKIIRQRFPKLTTRRLGTRGQSKYHYYGIGIKETSIYYQSVYNGKGLTRFSGTKVKTEGSTRKFSLSSKTGTLLPDFRNAENIALPAGISPEKLQTFTMMYRTHCQRVLDTVIAAGFDEVQSFLLHFWQGMPDHLTALMTQPLISTLIAYCDNTLYKVLIDVLIPGNIQELPDSLATDLRGFARRLPQWISGALDDANPALKERKLSAVKPFVQTLRRQVSFIHLAQTLRGVVLNIDLSAQMTSDLAKVDIHAVLSEACYASPHLSKHAESIVKYFDELIALIGQQSQVEALTEWLDNLVDAFVISAKTYDDDEKKDGAENGQDGLARRFVVDWSFVCAAIMKQLTLLSASSFGSCHLLHMTMNEYIFLILETQRYNRFDKEIQLEMKTYLRETSVGICDKTSKSIRPQVSPKLKKQKLRESEKNVYGQYIAATSCDDKTSSPETYDVTNVPTTYYNYRNSSHGPVKPYCTFPQDKNYWPYPEYNAPYRYPQQTYNHCYGNDPRGVFMEQYGGAAPFMKYSYGQYGSRAQTAAAAFPDGYDPVYRQYECGAGFGCNSTGMIEPLQRTEMYSDEALFVNHIPNLTKSLIPTLR